MMFRRGLLPAIVGIGLSSPATHEHSWHAGPFFITAARTFEEPDYYPPGSTVPVETCDCGLIRLPATLAKMRGRNMATSEGKP